MIYCVRWKGLLTAKNHLQFEIDPNSHLQIKIPDYN